MQIICRHFVAANSWIALCPSRWSRGTRHAHHSWMRRCSRSRRRSPTCGWHWWSPFMDRDDVHQRNPWITLRSPLVDHAILVNRSWIAPLPTRDRAELTDSWRTTLTNSRTVLMFHHVDHATLTNSRIEWCSTTCAHPPVAKSSPSGIYNQQSCIRAALTKKVCPRSSR